MAKRTAVPGRTDKDQILLLTNEVAGGKVSEYCGRQLVCIEVEGFGGER